MARSLFLCARSALRPPGEPGQHLVQFAAEVVAEQFHGADSLLTLRCAGGMELSARIAGPLSNGAGFAFQAQDLIPLEQE